MQVARHSPASRFITLFYGLYDPATGRLQYVNAGHLPPIMRRASGQFERIGGDATNGLALGMFERATYTTNEISIESGDTLVLFSDGITEAEDPRGRAFEDAGVEAVLTAEAAREPDAVGKALLAAVDRHAASGRLADDLTALVLKRA